MKGANGGIDRGRRKGDSFGHGGLHLARRILLNYAYFSRPERRISYLLTPWVQKGRFLEILGRFGDRL